MTSDSTYLDFRYISTIALNLKNPEVERLAAEVARLTGETKTEAIRKALAERRQRLAYRQALEEPAARVRTFLEREVWPEVPEEERDRRLTRVEEDEILGYGQGGA
jgi:antitoxin VapB